MIQQGGQVVDALSLDPHLRVLTDFVEGRRPLPAAWMMAGAAFPYPPAFLPIVHDTSGTMFGLWHHPCVARSPCFVAISSETSKAREVARTIQQFWAFLGLLAMTTLESETSELIERFLVGTNVSFSSIAETNREVGDRSELFGLHPVFRENPPSVHDGRFPSLSRPETWSLACGYELQVEDVRAPVWLSASGPSAFSDQLAARSWPGVWLSLNSPGWGVREAVTACSSLPPVFHEASSPQLSAWVREISQFSTGY